MKRKQETLQFTVSGEFAVFGIPTESVKDMVNEDASICFDKELFLDLIKEIKERDLEKDIEKIAIITTDKFHRIYNNDSDDSEENTMGAALFNMLTEDWENEG